MAWSWGGAGSGAATGATVGTMVAPGVGTLIGALLGGAGGGLLSGDGEDSSSGTNIQQLVDGILNQYSYMPQYTAQTESSLFDLFQRLTGQGNYAGAGNGDVTKIPFDIGLPTTGLYDSLTRGIKQDYLGTPGGPEGGKIADLRAYYNNLGIPEQAVNQERLGYQDMNNSLLDKAALINESQKDRLTNVLNMGLGTGKDLYAQNLAQHRFNTSQAMTGLGYDVGLSDAINQSNQNNLNSLLNGGGQLALGYYTGNPALMASGGSTVLNSSNLMGGQTQANSPYLGQTKKNSTASLISGSK